MGNLPSSSAIPGAVTNLLAIATSALPANTTVYFGPEMRAFTGALMFQVSEVTGDQEPAEMGTGYRREEKFALVCSLISYEGGAVDDFTPMLSSVMANFRLLHLAIANNPRLTDSGGNDAVRLAQVGNFHAHPEVDANGQLSMVLDFAVRCEARVTSLT